MELSAVSAISPVDGRYHKQTEALAYYFSEAAFINYRVFVEIEYFIALCKLPLPELADFDHSKFDELRGISRDFTFKNAEEVKQIEKSLNHDVKAVEYYIKKKFDKRILKRIAIIIISLVILAGIVYFFIYFNISDMIKDFVVIYLYYIIAGFVILILVLLFLRYAKQIFDFLLKKDKKK